MAHQHEEVVRSILKFMQEQQYYPALIALEKDSGVRLQSFGTEIDFFYDLLMEGRFEDAERFADPLQSSEEELYFKILYQLKKQRFLEAVEFPGDSKLDSLVSWLKDIEQISDKEEFQKLCYCLSLNKITDHPEYSDWTIWSGRRHCFTECLQFLKQVYASPPQPPPVSLLELVNPPACETGTIRSPRPNFPAPVKKKVAFCQSPVKESSDERKVMVEALELPSEDLGSYYEDSQEASGEFSTPFDPALLKETAQIVESKPIRACGFNAGGDYFAIGTNSGALKVCSLHNIVDGLLYNEHQGRQQFIDTVFEQREAHMGSIHSVAWSHNDGQLASGSIDRSVHVLYCPNFLDLQETQSEAVVYVGKQCTRSEGQMPDLQVNHLRGHTGTVRSVCYYPTDDKTLLSAAHNGELFVWNTETGTLVQKLVGHEGPVFSLDAAGNGSYFISVGADKKLRLWDLRTNTASLVLHAEHLTQPNAVALNVGSAQLKAETKKKITRMFMDRDDSVSFEHACHAAVGHSDGSVSLWDLNAAKVYENYQVHNNECRGLSYSPDAKWLCSASFDSTVGVFDLTKAVPHRLQIHTDKVVSAKWHPHLPILLTTSADKTARISTIDT